MSKLNVMLTVQNRKVRTTGMIILTWGYESWDLTDKVKIKPTEHRSISCRIPPIHVETEMFALHIM